MYSFLGSKDLHETIYAYLSGFLFSNLQRIDFPPTDINECQSNPCKNGTICNDAINGYSCTCAASYTGNHCEISKHVAKVLVGFEDATLN